MKRCLWCGSKDLAMSTLSTTLHGTYVHYLICYACKRGFAQREGGILMIYRGETHPLCEVPEGHLMTGLKEEVCVKQSTGEGRRLVMRTQSKSPTATSWQDSSRTLS